MSEQRLAGRAAVVTGGNSGIGLAIARALHREGARVAIFGRDAGTLEAAARELEPQGVAVQGDVTRLDDLERLCRRAADEFGGIDVLVVNAGVVVPAPLADTDEAAFDLTSDVNFKGAFFTVQASLPYLRTGGSVILITSGSNQVGAPTAPVYAATKAAVRSLARSFAAELVDRSIRVNALSPGFTDTPIFERSGMDGGQPDEFFVAVEAMIPMGRMGRPEEIAAAAVFLASDESSYITGAEIPVGGGLGQI